jgi:hypothetical protein
LLQVYRPTLVHPFSISSLLNQTAYVPYGKLILKADTLHLKEEGDKSYPIITLIVPHHDEIQDWIE